MTTKVPDALLVNGRGEGSGGGTGTAIPSYITVDYAPEITVDFSMAGTIRVPLLGDATITLTGAFNRQKCILELTQDEVGGRLATLVGHAFGVDLTGITQSLAPGLTDKIGMIYNAATNKYDVVAFMRGF